ncbi:TonB-dependent receptor [Stenotrophomonas maltophilia]|uniref:TonB-dependent receptor n=1 Tax=Stenotrophomonas maltophilia group TaxID=995085 RepID=UPI00070FB51A|nr:TonB-dependent receptor [Stenotrophomonas maltophilia]NNH47605.1 TonB-dependent receptor [Stenotrophomonas maltophilia]
MRKTGYPRKRMLVLAMLAAHMAPVVAAAQDSHQGDATRTTDLDKVNVTGSRIARTGFTTSSPVLALTAEEIRQTGAVTIGEVLSSLPQMSPTFTLGNSTRAIGTAGLGLIDLRGMGTSRTLVLVNGRRHVGGDAGETTVDVNTIPVELIERVEVITGGASAIYGADAVAGVVNFIMKKKFEGFEVRAQHGLAGEGGFNKSFVSATAGRSFAEGRGNAAISVELSRQGRFGRSERSIARRYDVSVPNPAFDPTRPPSEGNPENILARPGGNYALSYGGTFDLGGKFNYRDPKSYRFRHHFNPDGTFSKNRFDGPVPNPNSCVNCDFSDLNAVEDLQPKFERYSVNALVNFEITDNHRAFFEGKYTKTESEFFTQPSFDRGIVVKRDNAFISPQLGALMDANGADTLSISRFNVDAGRRGEEVKRETKRIVLGLEGSFGDNWSYEASANYGETVVDRINVNNRINERWFAGLDAVKDGSGKVVCRMDLDPGAINPDTDEPYRRDLMGGRCVPFSIMGHGAVSPEAAEWFNARSPYRAKMQQTVFSGSVSNNALFSLPAGDVGVAAGLEFRREKSSERTDPLSAAGNTFLNAIPGSGGSYNVKEAFAEFNVPLLADIPSIRRLSLDLAGRYSKYNTIGSTKTWNVGLDWEITSTLRARGTIARAIRAPSISEMFGPQLENFAQINDPCDTNRTNPNRPSTAADPALRAANCAALGIPAGWVDSYGASRPGVSGGNPNLKPERAETMSAGFVWQPEVLEGFGMSVDYWRINLEDAIGSVTAQTIATRCVDAPGGVSNKFCSLITRAPSGGSKGFPEYSVSRWVATAENLAKSRREGVDFEFSYEFGLGPGRMSTRLVGTRLLQSREWEFQDYPDEYTENSNSVTDPRWKGQFTTKYVQGNFRASWDMRYVHRNLRVTPDSYRSNPGSQSPIWNPSFTYHNLQVGYKISDSGVEVYGGIDNVFDKDPPVNYFGQNVGAAHYDNVGRFMYMGLNYKF